MLTTLFGCFWFFCMLCSVPFQSIVVMKGTEKYWIMSLELLLSFIVWSEHAGHSVPHSSSTHPNHGTARTHRTFTIRISLTLSLFVVESQRKPRILWAQNNPSRPIRAETLRNAITSAPAIEATAITKRIKESGIVLSFSFNISLPYHHTLQCFAINTIRMLRFGVRRDDFYRWVMMLGRNECHVTIGVDNSEMR